VNKTVVRIQKKMSIGTDISSVLCEKISVRMHSSLQEYTTASGLLQSSTRTYKAILYRQNVVRVHGTGLNLLPFTL
jgi:hypothetical protein